MAGRLAAEAIPEALRECPQWVCWKYIEREGKQTKMPINPHNLKPASSTDPATWADAETALAAAEREGMAGVGFVFTADDPFAGVDLDDCLDYFGKPVEQAQAIVDTLASYCEVSPSRAGVKLIVRGAIPSECNRHRTKHVEGFGEIEIYDQGRFFTITGDKLEGTPAEPQDTHGAFEALCRDYLIAPTAEPVQPAQSPATDDDEELLGIIRRSAQGSRFDRLWQGDKSAYGDDDSAADMALCVMLAWWTQRNADRMDRLFRRSALLRAKWDAKRGDTTYGRVTISKAIDLCPNCFQPSELVDWDSVLAEAARSAGKLERFLQDTIDGKRRPIHWPWPGLHVMTRALIPQTLTVVCGSPGASKSFMLLQSLAWWHERGIPVAAFMLEDSSEYHQRRAFAQRCRDSRLTDDEWIEENPDIVTELYEHHAEFFRNFDPCICEPPRDALADVELICGWLEYEAKQGKRVLAVDPITLADSGDKQFIGDRTLIARAKRVAEDNNISIILVTHPKNEAVRPHLDGVAGGKTITRAAQTVIWMEYLDKPEAYSLKDTRYHLRNSAEINRKVHVLKSRNGRGQGKVIGMNFKGDSLTFEEAGVLLEKEE